MKKTKNGDKQKEGTKQMSNTTFIVDRTKLLDALKSVSPVVCKYAINDTLNNVYIKATSEDQKLRLMATDLDLSIVVKLDAAVVSDCAASIPVNMLIHFLTNISGSECVCTITGSYLKVVCGNSMCNISGCDPENFPSENCSCEVSWMSTVENVKHFYAGLNLVKFSCDTNRDSKLNNFCIEYNENGLGIGATDGSILSCYTHSDNSYINPLKILIRRESILKIMNIIRGKEGHIAFAKRDIGENYELYIHCDDISIFVSGEDCKYPEYRKFIPETYEHKAVFNKSELTRALKSVKLFTTTIVLNFGNPKIAIVSSRRKSSEKDEVVEVRLELGSYEGSELEIAFNVKFMLGLLKSITTPTVELRMTDPIKPILVLPVVSEPDKKSNYVSLIMPIQFRDRGNKTNE